MIYNTADDETTCKVNNGNRTQFHTPSSTMDDVLHCHDLSADLCAREEQREWGAYIIALASN